MEEKEEILELYEQFDWEAYLNNYHHLKNDFNDKWKALWHYINIGKKEGYIFFDDVKKEQLEQFDWESYLICYPDLKNDFKDV